MDIGIESTSVLIIGGGPVGTALSALLSRTYGIANIVLEKEPSIPPDPRAFSLAEDGVRVLQTLGLYDHVHADLGVGYTWADFISGNHTDLNHAPFLRMNGAEIGTTGHMRSLLFEQAKMENLLRMAVAESGKGDIRVGKEVVEIEEDEKGGLVYVSYREINTNELKKIRSRFVVGTDGRKGYTRKMYLEPKGVVMENLHPYEQYYVGINWEVDAPTSESHPDFPLWKLGFSPTDVLDAFFPKSFKFLCHPFRQGCASRMGVEARKPLLYRQEFSLDKSEDPREMSKPEKVLELALPYMTHAGKRYGLPEDITFPRDCMNLRRAFHYMFQCKTASTWIMGRVMLAGDSAHVFPPFGGQGIQSGFLDVYGLAWRLAIVLQPSNAAKPFSYVLKGWADERKCHTTYTLNYTMKIGSILMETRPLNTFVRDWALWLVQMIPSVRRSLERPPVDPPEYKYEKGMPFLPHLGGGKCWFQVYCKEFGKEGVAFSDDLIFAGGKKSLFQLVVLLHTIQGMPSVSEVLKTVDKRLKETENLIDEATYIVQDSHAEEKLDGEIPSILNVCRVATAAEFTNSVLCHGRGVPEGYQENRLGRNAIGKTFIIVRPDRFIFAACKDRFELLQAIEAMEQVLMCESY